MGGVLSCGGHGYQPDRDDCRPYGSCVPQFNGDITKYHEDETSDVSKPIHGNNNNNDINAKATFSETTSHRPSWKFWQRSSLRRSNHKLKTPIGNKSPAKASKVKTKANLPDVVYNKSEIKRSSSLKPPPKPPRLFLFRSSSINTPRSSVIGETDRNSFVFSEAYQNGSGSDVKVNALEDKAGGVETENKTSIHKVSLTTQAAPVATYQKEIVALSAVQKCNSLPPFQKINTNFQDMGVTRRQPQKFLAGKIKIVSPELCRKSTSRTRKTSGEITPEDRHVFIMQSAVELICQKLDPFFIIEDLAEANILHKEDLCAFRGHPDRRLVCENIVQSVMDRDYASFLTFCDVLRSKTDYTTVAAVLDAMRAVYDVIYELPNEVGDGSPILDDEKSVSFDVVYFSLETGKIRSVVELEKSRNIENKRHSRDLLSYKRNSRLSFHSLTSEASSVFSEDIIHNGIPMVTVAISGHVLCSGKAKALARVLDENSCVLELHVGKTRLRGSDIEHISKSLLQNSSLKVLDLRLNTIGNEGAAYISKVLMKNRGIKQLNLSSTGIDAEGCKLIAESLRTNTCLIELDLSFLDIGDSGCIAISDALKQNRCLKKLRLRSDSITWIGCGFLIEGIEQGKTVTELDLSRNFIGDEGAEMFLRHMKDESCLKELNLENCGFTSIGCSTLSDVILTNKSLRNLDLSVNFIGDQGIIRLSNALVRNKHIRTLGLNMCGISNDGFSKLLDILESNPTLNLLKLCYNRLGREYINPDATSDNLKYRIRIVTSSNPKLKLLLWGNTFDDSHSLSQIPHEA